MKYKLKKISGDASFREFYRLKKNNSSSIIVNAKKDKYKNLIVYTVVNNILNSHKINAPKLLSNHIKNNMIEISDLGKKSFYDHVVRKKNKLSDYKSLINLLIKIQKIKTKPQYKLGKYKVKIMKYSLSNLHNESDLFFDWYLKYTMKKKNISKIKKILRAELNKIYKKLKYKNEKTFLRPLFISTAILFYSGVVFAYLVVMPVIFNFFINIAPSSIQIMTDINSYLGFVLKMLFGFGIALEVPVATFLVITTGLITIEKITAARPYLIISFFVIAMILTPPDIFSQLFLAIPMWILFEIGIILAKLKG